MTPAPPVLLIGLGCSAGQVKEALSMFDDDVARSVNYLCSRMST